MSESLKQLRASLTTLLTVALLWSVTAQPTADALARRAHAKELLAWLAVRDALDSAVDQLDQETPGIISCFIRVVQIQSGTEVEECNPISVSLPIFEHASGTLNLIPIPDLISVYRVSSTIFSVPLSSYVVAAIHNALWVIPSDLSLKTQRDFYNAALRDGLATPRKWAALKAELYSLGWDGSESKDLKINDPTVSKFLSQVFTATFSVASVPVSAPLYPIVVSAFVCLIGFLMLGPLLKMSHASGGLESEPWIMLARVPGKLGIALTGIQALVAVCYALIPVFIYVTQLRLWPLLEPSERIIWVVPSTLLFAVSVVIVIAAWRLWQLRSSTATAQ